MMFMSPLMNAADTLDYQPKGVLLCQTEIEQAGVPTGRMVSEYRGKLLVKPRSGMTETYLTYLSKT